MKNSNSANLIKSNAIWLVFIAEVIIFAIASGGTFLTPNNVVNISRQVSYYGIASIGMTFVILIAGIDLSIGSIITFVNVICAYMMVNMGMNMWVAVIISLIFATAIGTLNGAMVASIGIPAEAVCFASGVTTAVDAGSTGCSTEGSGSEGSSTEGSNRRRRLREGQCFRSGQGDEGQRFGRTVCQAG